MTRLHMYSSHACQNQIIANVCWLIFNMLMIVKTMCALPLNYIELFIAIVYAVFRKALRTFYVSLSIYACVYIDKYVCVFCMYVIGVGGCKYVEDTTE